MSIHVIFLGLFCDSLNLNLYLYICLFRFIVEIGEFNWTSLSSIYDFPKSNVGSMSLDLLKELDFRWSIKIWKSRFIIITFNEYINKVSAFLKIHKPMSFILIWPVCYFYILDLVFNIFREAIKYCYLESLRAPDVSTYIHMHDQISFTR